jgi:hypothetical protein
MLQMICAGEYTEDGCKIKIGEVYTVYNTRNSEFLIYDGYQWFWVSCAYFKPYNGGALEI